MYDILWFLSSNFTSVMCGHQHRTQHYASNIGCRKVTTSSSPRSFWASILLRFTEVKAQKPCTENSCWDDYLQWPQNPVLSHCFPRISQPSSITSFLCSQGCFALCCIMIYFVWLWPCSDVNQMTLCQNGLGTLLPPYRALGDLKILPGEK